MADRSHGSRTYGKQRHGGSHMYGSSNTGQSHASSTYSGDGPYASSSRQTNPASGLTQGNYTAAYGSSDVYTTDHRYHQVSRNWTSPRPERERVLNHPALAYNPNHSSNQNHGYGSQAAHTYQLHPDQLAPGPDRSSRFTSGDLHRHDQQTRDPAALIQWAQQNQQEEPWNGVGSVRKRSEFDPYHTKL